MNSESVSDYIISSYTPTLDTLLAPKPLIDIPFKMMVTIQPKALPCTLIEMCKIEDHVSSECLLRLGIPNVPASVNRVFSELPTVSIAHFACHGEQNMKNPLESALILDDGPLKVSRLIQQSMPNASLAFLSACQTAVGDENLPDEAFHLAGTMLFVGYRGVVATMWSVPPFYLAAEYSDLFNVTGQLLTVTDQRLRIPFIVTFSRNKGLLPWMLFNHTLTLPKLLEHCTLLWPNYVPRNPPLIAGCLLFI